MAKTLSITVIPTEPHKPIPIYADDGTITGMQEAPSDFAEKEVKRLQKQITKMFAAVGVKVVVTLADAQEGGK